MAMGSRVGSTANPNHCRRGGTERRGKSEHTPTQSTVVGTRKTRPWGDGWGPLQTQSTQEGEGNP
eukprot:8366628-Prorocentrum_lima.AAC.1